MSLEEYLAEQIRRAVADEVPRAVEAALRKLLPAPDPSPRKDNSRMTPEEVAARFKRDVSTVRRWARQGILPASRVHGRLLFRTADVDALEASGGAIACDEDSQDPKVVALRLLKKGG